MVWGTKAQTGYTLTLGCGGGWGWRLRTRRDLGGRSTGWGWGRPAGVGLRTSAGWRAGGLRQYAGA